MSNDIPTKSREILKTRDQGHCLRCSGWGNQWHHRRRRGIKDEHTHAACNGVTLCTVCHAWVHSSPKAAKALGWIVSPDDDPHEAPVHTYLLGWVLFNHDGTHDRVGECVECGRITFTESDWCMACLRKEVCCTSAHQAAASMCGCGGQAAEQLRRLIDRVGERYE